MSSSSPLVSESESRSNGRYIVPSRPKCFSPVGRFDTLYIAEATQLWQPVVHQVVRPVESQPQTGEGGQRTYVLESGRAQRHALFVGAGIDGEGGEPGQVAQVYQMVVQSLADAVDCQGCQVRQAFGQPAEKGGWYLSDNGIPKAKIFERAKVQDVFEIAGQNRRFPSDVKPTEAGERSQAHGALKRAAADAKVAQRGERRKPGQGILRAKLCIVQSKRRKADGKVWRSCHSHQGINDLLTEFGGCVAGQPESFQPVQHRPELLQWFAGRWGCQPKLSQLEELANRAQARSNSALI
eukprot:scaffold60464_cov38-Prasinocladus_malaysianus.AAC.2